MAKRPALAVQELDAVTVAARSSTPQRKHRTGWEERELKISSLAS